MALKKSWNIRGTTSKALELATQAKITQLQAQLLINRGISDPGSVKSFLQPRLVQIADPMLLPDMEEAVDLIIRCAEQQRFITIYGDYDADGLTASALVFNFLRECGIPSYIYIPHRLKQGYGLNPQSIRHIARTRKGLLITVDCGISNSEEIKLARHLGMEVVVTDHHRLPNDYRRVCPTINPHRPDSAFPDKNLSGVGVAFMLALALRMGLRQKGWFSNRGEPDLKNYLDLVALGTVADQVPLLNHNRIFVYNGIKLTGESRWPGISALLTVAGLNGKKLCCDDIAFRLAPRLNAPGRVDTAEICAEILTTTDEEKATKMAYAINQQNQFRQSLEQAILRQIEKAIPLHEILKKKLLIMGQKGWHQGVLGIVASRLVDMFHRPCIVYSLNDGLAIGSGRSIDNFDLHRALSSISEILERFGGHSHAAGFTVKMENMKEFERRLESIADDILMPEDLRPVIDIDMEIDLDQIDSGTTREIKILAPFGRGNPEPLFCARGAKVLECKIVGERHIKMRVRGKAKVHEAIGFGMSDRKLPTPGTFIDLAFTPEMNYWQGYETLQLRISDFRQGSSNL